MPEQDLIKDLVRYIEFLEKSSPQAINVTAQQKRDMNQYRRLQEEILIRQNIRPQERELTFTEYAEHTLKNGDMVKKKQVVQSLKKQLYLHDKRICTATI